MRRKPLSVREGFRDQDLDALHQGVPDWLEGSLWGWFETAVERIRKQLDIYMIEVIRIIEVGLQRPLNSEETERVGLERALRPLFRSDPEMFLDVVDHLIPRLKDQRATLEYLDSMLYRGGSIWTLERDGLARRLPQETRDAAAAAMAPGDRASQHLMEAWADVYGRNPDPSDGYNQSVKAVESVAQPVVLPNDLSATLGKMIASMRTKPSKWALPLQHPDREKQVEQVVGMMELLWKGQHDRHGTADETMPSAVSQEEAEAALHLAVTLVQWFRTGVVRPTT